MYLLIFFAFISMHLYVESILFDCRHDVPVVLCMFISVCEASV